MNPDPTKTQHVPPVSSALDEDEGIGERRARRLRQACMQLVLLTIAAYLVGDAHGWKMGLALWLAVCSVRG